MAGRFRLRERVGQGSLAEVWRADEVATARHVALKILHVNLRDNHELCSRFRREFLVTSRIDSPHVVRSYELVEAEGEIFLVMPFVAGTDLERFIHDHGPLDEPQLLTLATHMCEALKAAHAAGVIHRDLKPQNVLVERHATGLCFLLTDFGLAKTMEALGLTTANAVLGTPAYMAPEVVLDGHADPRSDLYSLGALLYEAATGHPPFSGDSPYAVFHQQVSAAVVPLRERGVRLSASAESAILRALEKDPLDRYADAASMAAAITDRAPVENAAGVAVRTQLDPATCPACGGVWLQAVGLCPACGHEALGVSEKRGRVTVMLTGPGKRGSRLTTEAHVQLARVLKKAAVPGLWRKQRSLPRWPVVVAKWLDDHDAKVLVKALSNVGFRVRLVTKPAWLTAEGWGLASQQALKVLGICSFSVTQMLWFFIENVALLGAAGAVVVGSSVAAGARSLRPHIGPVEVDGRALPIALGRRLVKLSRVHERHAAARLLQMVGWLAAQNQQELSDLLCQRALDVTSILATLDEADARWADTNARADEALVALREGERVRVVATADLLRLLAAADAVASRLTVAKARGQDLTSSEQVKDAWKVLEVHLEAQQEVRHLLEGTWKEA